MTVMVERELDAVIRAGLFRDRDHAFQEAVETLFTVRPPLPSLTKYLLCAPSRLTVRSADSSTISVRAQPT